jgi:hypothetical protein
MIVVSPSLTFMAKVMKEEASGAFEQFVTISVREKPRQS